MDANYNYFSTVTYLAVMHISLKAKPTSCTGRQAGTQKNKLNSILYV